MFNACNFFLLSFFPSAHRFTRTTLPQVENGIKQAEGSGRISSPACEAATTALHEKKKSGSSSSKGSNVTQTGAAGRSKANPAVGQPHSSRLFLPLTRPPGGLGSQLPSPSSNAGKGSGSSNSIACGLRSNHLRPAKRSERPAGFHVTESKKKNIQQISDVCSTTRIRQQAQQENHCNNIRNNKHSGVTSGRLTASSAKGNSNPQTPVSAAPAVISTASAASAANLKKRQTVCPGSASAKAAGSLLSLQKEVEKWKRTSESHKKSLESTRRSMAHSLQAFDSFGVLIRYLTEQLSAFSNPILCLKLELAMKRCRELEEGVTKKEQEIKDLESVKENREGDLLDEIDQWKRELDASCNRHKNEKEKLLEMHELEMKLLHDKHASELRMQSEKERGVLAQVDEREKRIGEKNQELSQLSEKIRHLEGSLRQDKDKRMRGLQDKLKTYEDEVSSLKVVLELRDEKIRSMNVQVMGLEEMCKELPSAKQSICLLRQKLEQLEISMEKKTDQIKRLFAENQELKYAAESTIQEKKRLSLRNEELEYVLSESFIASTPAAAKSLTKSASLTQVPSSHRNILNPAASVSKITSREDGEPLMERMNANLFNVKPLQQPQTPIPYLSERSADPLTRRKKRAALLPFTPPLEVNESMESATSAGDKTTGVSIAKPEEEEDNQMTAFVQQEEQGPHEEQKDLHHHPNLENERAAFSSPPPVFIAVHASPFSSNGLEDQANLVTSCADAPTSCGITHEDDDDEEEGDGILLHSHSNSEAEAESESGFHSHDPRLDQLQHPQNCDPDPGAGHQHDHLMHEQNNIRPYTDCCQSPVPDKSWKSDQEECLLSNQQEENDDEADAVNESLNPYPCVRLSSTAARKRRSRREPLLHPDTHIHTHPHTGKTLQKPPACVNKDHILSRHETEF